MGGISSRSSLMEGMLFKDAVAGAVVFCAPSLFITDDFPTCGLPKYQPLYAMIPSQIKPNMIIIRLFKATSTFSR